jgi:hypothetical protein
MNSVDRTAEIPALPNQAGLANVPGLRRLWLIEVRHVLRFIDPRTQPNALDGGWYLPDSGLTLTDNALIHDWRFSATRGGFEEKVLNSVQGIQYGQAIKLILPNDHPLTALAIERMVGRKWLAIYTDGNGLVRLVGTPAQPLRLEQTHNTTPNRRELTWTGNTRQPAYYLRETDTTLFRLLLAYQYDFSLY